MHGLSMRREDAIRIRHMTEAAEKALAFTRGRTRQDLDDDELLRLAVTKLVEIVSEAAKQGEPGRARQLSRRRLARPHGCATA